MTSSGEFTLQVPAENRQVRTVRLFVTSLGSTVGLQDEALEDLKLAAAEACNLVLATSDAGSLESINLKATHVHGVLLVELSSTRGPRTAPGEHTDNPSGSYTPDAVEMGSALITALYPQSEIDRTAGGTSVKLRIPA